MVNSGPFDSSNVQESDKNAPPNGCSPPAPPTTDAERSLEDKLRCSVPLEKLDGVLTTYQPPEDSAKTRSTTRKLLCLYCDRTFVSVNLRQKHVERAHSSKSGRRVSSRKQNHLTATPCAYCDTLSSTDNTLKDLFQHLVQQHPDKYFGCLPCEDRFLTQALLNDHHVNVHRASCRTTDRIVKSSPAKTTLKETPPEELFQEKEVVIKITRSRVKPRQEEVAEEAKAAKTKVKDSKGKRLSVKSSRMALKKRESKRLQDMAKVADNAKKKRAKPERKQQAEQQNSTKTEKQAKAGANPYPEFDNFYRVKKITDHSIDNLKIGSLTFDDVFDKAFFNRIKCNIEENLLHHIDGKLFENEESETRISNFEKVSNATQEIQNANSDNYGCELSLNAVTPVAALSLNSQFGEDFESQIEYGSKPSKKKAQAKTDHQVFHYKYFTRRKFQASILQQKENRDLSKLDMWTQLVIKNRQQKIIDDKKTAKEIQEYATCDEYKSKVKREELNRILDRRGPFEDLKEEASKKAALDKLNSASPDRISHESFTEVREVLDHILERVFVAVGDADADVVEEKVANAEREDVRELPSYLNLRRTSALPSEGDVDRSDRIALICSSQETENYELPTNQARRQNELIELSGEWARCRMYVCAACGAKLPNMKYLLDHKSLYHQNVWVQHYEFVGNQNELYRHLSIPALGKVGFIEDNFQCKNWKRSEARSCTKCGKQCNSLGELHRHILECGGDWSWMMARKKCKYRPCKSRRKRLRGLVHRIRHKEKDDEGPTEKKKYKKTFEGPRQRPSDAETIQRMLANLPAKRSTRKLISLYDGVYRARKNNQIQPQNLNQKKVKCGKVIYKSSNIKENTEKTINAAPPVIKTQKPSQSSNRRSLRNMSRVLSSRILDTNANLNVKRKLKALSGQKSNTRQSVQAEVGAPEEADTGKRKLSNQDSIIHKRTSPRSVPKNMKMMNMKKLLAGNINMKSFFPVKKQKSRKAPEKISDAKTKTKRKSNEPESVAATREEKPDKVEEPKTTKGGALKKIVKTLSMKKKPDSQTQSSLTDDTNPVEGDKSNSKRKLKRSFRNVINRVKRLKIDSAPESLQIDAKEIDSKSTFLGETNVEHRNQSVKIVIPSNSEAKENLADISESAHIATNFNKANGDSPVPENIFKLGTNDEKSLQAKGDLDFDSQQVKNHTHTLTEKKTETETPPANKKIEPLTIETSEKPRIVPLVSPNVKGKIKKPTRGLNDCIAMLTSKLQQKTSEPAAKVSVFSAMFPTNAPKVLTDPTPQKSDCILKIPTFKTQQEQPSGLEETALDLSVKSKGHHQSSPEMLMSMADKSAGAGFGFAEKPPFEPFPFSIHPTSSVERIINSVIENNFQKESHRKIWKTWNAVDETIQCVIDGCDRKIPGETLNVSKNSVDDVIDFVATYSEDNNNKSSLILKQPGDRLKLKTAKKLGPSKKSKKSETTIDITPIVTEDIPRRNEGSPLLVPTPSGAIVLEASFSSKSNLDATIECVIKDSSSEESKPKLMDPVAKTSVKKLSQFRRSKDKQKNGTHVSVETHLDDVLDTSEVDCKPEGSTSPFRIHTEESKTEQLALANEDDPHVLENKVVVRQHPSDSEDDNIPLAALVKPIVGDKNEVIDPAVPVEECISEFKPIEEVAEKSIETSSGSVEKQAGDEERDIDLSTASQSQLESTPQANTICDNDVVPKISEDADSAKKEIQMEIPNQAIKDLAESSDSKVPVPNSKKSRNKKRSLSKKKPRKKVGNEKDVSRGLHNIVDETERAQELQPEISTIPDEIPSKELTMEAPEHVEETTREGHLEESIPLPLPILVDEIVEGDVILNQETATAGSLVEKLPFANEEVLPDVLSVPKRKRAKKTKFSRKKTKKKNAITTVEVPTESVDVLEKEEHTDLCDTSEETSSPALPNAITEECHADGIVTENKPEDVDFEITTAEEVDFAHASSISESTNAVELDSVTAIEDASGTETKIKQKKNHRLSEFQSLSGAISEASDIENTTKNWIRDLEIRLSDTTEHSFKIPMSDDSVLSDGSKPKNVKKKGTRPRTKTIKRSRSLNGDLGMSSSDESSASPVELRSRSLKKYYREPSSDESFVNEPTTSERLDSDSLLSETPSKSDVGMEKDTSADIISETLTTLRKELGLPSEDLPPKRSTRLSATKQDDCASGIASSAPGLRAETHKATVAETVFKTPTKKRKPRKTSLVVSTDESDLNENSDLSNTEESPDKKEFKSLRSVSNRLASESDLEENSQSDIRTRGGSRTLLKEFKEPGSNEIQREVDADDVKVSNSEKLITAMKTRRVSKKRCKPSSKPSATLNESIESTGNSESSDSDFVDIHSRRPIRKSRSLKTDASKSFPGGTVEEEIAEKAVDNEESEETRRPKRSSRLLSNNVNAAVEKADELPTKETFKTTRSNGKHEAPLDVSVESVDPIEENLEVEVQVENTQRSLRRKLAINYSEIEENSLVPPRSTDEKVIRSCPEPVPDSIPETEEVKLIKPLQNSTKSSRNKKKANRLNISDPLHAPETVAIFKPLSEDERKIETPVVVFATPPEIIEEKETEPPITIVINKQKARRKSKSIKKIDSKGHNDLFEDFALVIKKKRTTPFMSFSPPDTFSKEDEDSYQLFLPKPTEIQQVSDEKDLSNEEVEDQAELDVSVEEMDMELDEIPINASIIENTLNIALPIEKPNEANDLTLLFDPPLEEIKPISKSLISSKNKTKNGRKNKSSKSKKLRQLSSDNDTESELENSVESLNILPLIMNEQIPEVTEEKSEVESQTIFEQSIFVKITAQTTSPGAIEESAEIENTASSKVEGPEKSIEVPKATEHEKPMEKYPEFDSPTMPHTEIEIKQNLSVGEKLYALMKSPTDVEKPKSVKKTAKRVKGKAIKGYAEFDNQALSSMENVEMNTFIGKTLDEIESKGKSMEELVEMDVPNTENIEKDVLVAEKFHDIVKDPDDAEHSKTEKKLSKKAKGKSAKECVENDLPVLPHVINIKDSSVDLKEVMESSITVKIISKKPKVKSGAEFDIPLLPPSENILESNLIPTEVEDLITVKQASSKKFKGNSLEENVDIEIRPLNLEPEKGLASEEESDGIVQKQIENEKTKATKRTSKKYKRKSIEEHDEFDWPSSSPIRNPMEDKSATATAEKQKPIKKANRKCKGRLNGAKDDITDDGKVAASETLPERSSSSTETFIELDSKPNSAEVLRSEVEDSSPSTGFSCKPLLNGPTYSNIPPLDDTDHPESSKKDKDIDLIYAFSETEDVEINTPIELPRRLPRNVDKISGTADDPAQKEDEQKAKKKLKQKKVSLSENDEEDKATGTGEVKENGIDLEENGRRKPMRSAKVKALEYIHDDALAELTESQRNREQKTTKVAQNGSDTTIENTNKKNKKQKKNQMAPEVIENDTFSYEALAEDEAPLLAELVAELHGLEELENSIERELNADMSGAGKLMTEDRTVEEPALEESIPNIGSEATSEENQELRRSRRGSRKVASYNENDLIDPIIDALENKRNAKKKDTKAANVDNKNQKKTKEEKKLNSDQLFDLLKASTAENSFVPKQQNSFLNNLGDASRDISGENFDTVFRNLQDKHKDTDKIYDFNESSVTTEPVVMNKSLIVSKQSDESSLSSSSYKLLTPDIQDSSTSEDSKSGQVAVNESNYCDICNKSFIRVENLVKHRRTLTHIQKLSEIEAKEAELKLHRERMAQELPTTFANTHSLKLADIISDVLNKPVLGEEASNFPDIVKRYKSLGERKSFESEPTPFESKTTILEKQISLLEDIIENKGNTSYIDDISMSSEDSALSSKRAATPKNDSAKTVGDDSFLKPTQYEEISEDSANLRNYEDQKLRKTLNRDEELFLECCSLLKSGSEVSSSYSNKKLPHKDLGSVNVRQADWPQKRNPVRKPELDLEDDYSDDNSRIPTPLGDSFDDDASNSNTISSNWGVNDGQTCVKGDGSTRTDFQGISAEKRESLKEVRSPSSPELPPKASAAEPKNEEVDSKKIITKGARKVFEGLKVSIPTEELNLEEVLNCSPKPRKPEVPIGSDKFPSPTPSKPTKSARKSKPVKKSQVGSNILFKVNKKKLLSPTALPQAGSEKQDKDSKSYDVYDFEETQDNTDVFTKPDYKTFRSTKTGDSETESTDPFGLEPESVTSSASSISSAKKSKDQENITRKKCMIMGRIFKNAAKSKIEDIDEEIRTIPTMDNGELVQNYVASCSDKLSDENETNQLFEEVLDAKPERASATKTAKTCAKPRSEARKPDQKKKRQQQQKGKKRARANSESTDDEFSLNTSKRRSGKRSGKEEDNCINLEQELKECIGVASRKSQRSCTSGKQNVLVEYWSSDDSQFEAMLEKQVIAKRPAVVEEEPPAVEVEAVQPKKKRPAEKKSMPDRDLGDAAASNRRKRAAANPLYHWSSSSEDETGDLIEVNSRDKVEDEEERPVQHGWIVGESPKKLVMMLAQAKGKKTDIDCVKEQGKKRTSAVS